MSLALTDPQGISERSNYRSFALLKSVKPLPHHAAQQFEAHRRYRCPHVGPQECWVWRHLGSTLTE